MKIKFHGAAGGEVTGSAYLVQTKHARVLVDCGMFQGGRDHRPFRETVTLIQQRYGLRPVLPMLGDIIEL